MMSFLRPWRNEEEKANKTRSQESSVIEDGEDLQLGEQRSSLPVHRDPTPAERLLQLAKSANRAGKLAERTEIIGQLDAVITDRIRNIKECFDETKDTLARYRVDIDQMSPKEAAEFLFARVQPDAPAPEQMVEEGERSSIQDENSRSSVEGFMQLLRHSSISQRDSYHGEHSIFRDMPRDTISSVRGLLARFVEVNRPLVAAIKSIMADSRLFTAHYRKTTENEVIASAADFCVDMADSMAKMQEIAALLAADPFAAPLHTLETAVKSIPPIIEQCMGRLGEVNDSVNSREHADLMTLLPTQVERALKIAKDAINSAMEVAPTSLLFKAPLEEDAEKEYVQTGKVASHVRTASRRQAPVQKQSVVRSGQLGNSRAAISSFEHEQTFERFVPSVKGSVRESSQRPSLMGDMSVSAGPSLKSYSQSLQSSHDVGGCTGHLESENMPNYRESVMEGHIHVKMVPILDDLRPMCHGATVEKFVNDLKDLYGQLLMLLELNNTASAYTDKMREAEPKAFRSRFMHSKGRFDKVRDEILELLTYASAGSAFIMPTLPKDHPNNYRKEPFLLEARDDEEEEEDY